MASSSSGNSGGDTEGEGKIIPDITDLGKHFKTLGISPDMSFKEAHKKYLKEFYKHHPDRGGDTLVSQMISQAWTKINEFAKEDEEKFSELVKQYFDTENEHPMSPEDIDLDEVLSDKTLSTNFRKFFESIANSKILVEDDYHSFYEQVFSKVQVNEKLNQSTQCQICDGETFMSLEDHSTAVYYPYYDFLIGGNPHGRSWVGFEKYLGQLLGEEVVTKSRTPVVYPVYNEIDTSEQLNLVIEHFQNNVSDLGEIMKNQTNLCEKGKSIPGILEDSATQLSEKEIIFLAISHHDGDCNGKCKDICIALLPLLFKGKQEKFTKWGNLAIKIYDWGFPEWSIVFVRAAMHFGDENACVQLAEHLVRKGDNARAHHCYSVIGSCDLKLTGNMLGEKKIGSKLAAMYLRKTSDFKGLEKCGERYCGVAGNRNEAAHFLLPLIFPRLWSKNYDILVDLLTMLLPKSMVFRSIQELAHELVEKPDFEIYECVAIADAVLSEVERVCGENLLGKVPNIYVEESKEYVLLSPETDDRLNALTALPGAFHILLGSSEKEKYEDRISKICQHLLAPLLAEAVLRRQFHLICILAKCSGMKKSVERVLTDNRMKWREDGGDVQRDLPIGQLYGSALYLLRAVYNYKRAHISEMRHDLELAYFCGVGHSKVGESIVAFMGTCPDMHEKIMGSIGTQFQILSRLVRLEDIEMYFAREGLCMESPDFSELPNIFPTPSNFGLGSILERSGGKFGKLAVVEKKILMESDPEKVGFMYLDLVSLAVDHGTILCCCIQAVNHFYKAMKSNDNVGNKYAFVQLIEKVCEEMEQLAGNGGSSKNMYMLQVKLSCLLKAHFNLSSATRKQKGTWLGEAMLGPYKLFRSYIMEGNSSKGQVCGGTEPADRVKKYTQDWQQLLNLGTLCPLTTGNLYSVGDGCLALELEQKINNQVILEYIRADMNADWEIFENRKSTMYLYTHHVFNELWRGRISPENIPVRPTDRIVEDENLPLVQKQVFNISKNRVIRYAADLFGYNREEVDNMMHWHRIRRDLEGFIDTQNRSLNFDGETAYSQLNAVHIDMSCKEFSFLLTREDKEDDNSPPLFGWTDIAEGFGNGICGGLLSFEPENVAARLDTCEKLNLPYFPLFKVEYEGIGADGKKSKELLCGTNVLMTKYHADLLVKMLSTGQEVSGTFPYAYKDTQTGLLANLPERLKKILTPVGQRKKAEKLRAVENIHRFWIHAGKVEQCNEELGSEKMDIRFGDVALELRVMRMMVDKDGKLIDAEHLLDQEGPEVRFVKDFNQNIDLIMKYFPLLRRLKELAKISLCYQLLHNIFKGLEKDKPEFNVSFRSLLEDNFDLPTWRPYSDCVRGETCHCCDWVPAVFQEMVVTDEQKLDYLWRFKRGGAKGMGANAIEYSKKPMLGWEGTTNATAAGSPSMFNEPSTSSGGASKSTRSKKLEFNAKDHDLVTRYGAYGGVCLAPTSKIVERLPPRSYHEKANLRSGTYFFNGRTQRFDLQTRLGVYQKTGYRAADVSANFIQAKASQKKVVSSSASPGSNGSSGNGDDNNNKKKGRKLKTYKSGPYDPKKRNVFPADDPVRINHIYKDEEGHFSKAQDTPETRDMLTKLVNEKQKNLKPEMTQIFGTTEKRWYYKTLKEGPYKGQELWAYTQGNVLWDGGINKVPEYNKK